MSHRLCLLLGQWLVQKCLHQVVFPRLLGQRRHQIGRLRCPDLLLDNLKHPEMVLFEKVGRQVQQRRRQIYQHYRRPLLDF